MNVGVSFDDLSAYDAKYHPQCLKTYMRDNKSDKNQHNALGLF